MEESETITPEALSPLSINELGDTMGGIDKTPKTRKYKKSGKYAKINTGEKYLRRGVMKPDEKKFADIYLATGNASEAARQVYPEVRQPSIKGLRLVKREEIQAYIMSNADKCAKIQMDIIESASTPAAVRNDAIKYRLDVVGVRQPEEDERKGFNIEKLVIQIDKD